MITLKEKYEGVGNSLTLLHNTFYHVKPFGSGEQGALYQGLYNKLYNKSPDIFSANNFLFYCDTDKILSFRFDGKFSELIADKASIFKKIGSVYLGTNADSITSLYNKSFQLITGVELVNKLLFYSDDRFLIYRYKDSEYLSGGRIIPKDPRNLRVIECTDFRDNILWTYTSIHLGFYETIEKVNREFDVNKETGELIEKLTILETKQNPVLFYNGVEPLVIGNVMLMGTNNSWIIALDINTGKELYIIKRIEAADFRHPLHAFPKPLFQGGPSAAGLRYYAQDDIVYSFIDNTYLEIDYKTGKLLLADNRTNEFMVLHKSIISEYWRVDDIIYYISDMDREGDKKKITTYLTAYNVKTREIVFEFPLGKSYKEKCGLHAFKKFKLVGNLFYILDYYNTLWVFEDDEFYLRHPDHIPIAQTSI